jgi:hypothetical protein
VASADRPTVSQIRLHALQEVLVMGDVEEQGQLRRWLVVCQRGAQAAVVGAAGMQGRKARRARFVRQAGAAVEPGCRRCR